MNVIVTEAFCHKILLLLKMDYKGKYQRRLIVEALRNDTVAVKAARQSGKSFIASIIATAYLLLGKSVIIALPTLTQGTRLIFGQVRRNIMKLQRYRKLYPAISLVKNTQYELVLANGGKITVLSTSDNANREGYTASLLIIDEAHDAKSSVLEDLSPMLNVAREHDEDRIILLGHGGAKKSLIEIATKERGFHSIVIDCYEVVEDYPPYQNVIDKDKRILSDAEFKVHYECKEIMVGATKIIPHIKLVEPIQGFKSYIHGIDVGGTSEHSDWTYCIRLEQQNDKLNIVGKIKLRNVKALEEADILVKYIDEVDRYHGACGIEINGIGHKLRDIIQAKVLDIRSITMSNAKHKGRKYHLIRKLQKLCIDGKITSSDSEIKNELESLSVMVDDDGITTYEHSDVLSALLIALTCTKGLNEIFSV